MNRDDDHREHEQERRDLDELPHVGAGADAAQEDEHHYIACLAISGPIPAGSPREMASASVANLMNE